MKICVVGGGSTYTPELVDGILRRRDRLPASELVLLDPNHERLEIVGRFARRMCEASGSDLAIAPLLVNQAATDDQPGFAPETISLLGAVPSNLPDDVVVEMPARIGRDGAVAVPTAPLRADLEALVRSAKADASLAPPVWEHLCSDNAGLFGMLDG